MHIRRAAQAAVLFGWLAGVGSVFAQEELPTVEPPSESDSSAPTTEIDGASPDPMQDEVEFSDDDEFSGQDESEARPVLPQAWNRVLDRPPVPGDRIEITFLDGRMVEGEFVEGAVHEHGVKVRIAGVTLMLDPDEYKSILVRVSAREQFKQIRASIADDDVDRLLVLCEWLILERLYVEANEVVAQILAQQPQSGDALRVQRISERLLLLSESAPDRVRRSRESGDDSSLARRPRPEEFPLLTPEEINLIKVYEIDLEDPPRVNISRDTISELLRTYPDSALVPSTRQGREAFYRLDSLEILDIIFRLQARELYGQVEVQGQPESMKLFRDHVHAGWMVNSCATTRCHGGTNAGRLYLTNRKPTYEPSVYTNFLIIERFETEDGSPMINYDAPSRSALLQMGLPRGDALLPHPDVRGWRPVFRSRDARRFRQAVAWIESMYRPRPVYPIRYDPPSPLNMEADADSSEESTAVER